MKHKKLSSRGTSAVRVMITCFFLALLMVSAGCGKGAGALPLTPPEIEKGIPEGRPVYTDGAYIVQLYQLGKDTIELLEKHNVVYWIDGGTLLGAFRSKGIIRWDDDIDICIAPDEEKKFLALEPEFKKLGYRFEATNIVGYHVALENNPLGVARLDVLTTIETDGKYFYKQWPHSYRAGEKSYYTKDEVFPRKRYQFGALSVFGPNSPENYLFWQYGISWNYKGVQDRTHRAGSDLKKVQFVLTDEDRKPAEPFGPLLNRVQ